MDPKTRIQGLRNSALEMADQHGRYLESWELARAQAAALGEALYSASGLEPRVPLEQWDWTSASILSRLRQACDNILRRMLQPQQGGDAEVREAIGGVRNILISASDFKPGMSNLGRLTKILKDWPGQDKGQNGPEKDHLEKPEICEAVITGNNTYVCDLHKGHTGSHSGPMSREVSILRQRNGKPGIQTEIDARIETVNVDDIPDIGLRLRVTICGDQVATAEASDEFLERSNLEFDFDKDHVQEELALALLEHMRGAGKRLTVLSWDDAYGNGLMRGRLLIQKNSSLMATFAYYDFSDGSTGPESIPEYIRDGFRNAFHESLLNSMSKEKFESHEMSPKDVEKRLVAMREHYGFSDEEVVASAIAGTIPADPDYCEWLVLLGRSDLIRT